VIDREAPKRLAQPRAGARGWRNSTKSTPDEGGRRVEEVLADLETYIPLTAPALARASGVVFRADEVTAGGNKGRGGEALFTSLHLRCVPESMLQLRKSVLMPVQLFTSALQSLPIP